MPSCPALAAACLLVLTSALPWAPVMAQGIQRCTTADGVSVFTDKPCELMQARSRLRAPGAAQSSGGGRARLGAHSGMQCPQRLSELVDEIQLAIQASDINRLAAVYWWGGQGNAQASRQLAQLETIVSRALVDIAPVYPRTSEPSQVAAPGWITVAPANAGPPPEPAIVAPPASRPRPYALRIEQVLANGSTPAPTLLHLRRQYGCFWISL